MIASKTTAALSVFRTLTLMKSPAAASHTMGAVFNSAGVVPAVPPACTGLSSAMVSEPLVTVTRPGGVTVAPFGERMRHFSRAGQGRYWYCQLAKMLSLVAPVAIDPEKVFCG